MFYLEVFFPVGLCRAAVILVTALHGMQMRSSDENSVRPYGRL